jgi:hypothetical protein
MPLAPWRRRVRLYGFSISRRCRPSRKATAGLPFLGRIPTGATMLDILLLALGLGFFAVAIAYAYACEIL